MSSLLRRSSGRNTNSQKALTKTVIWAWSVVPNWVKLEIFQAYRIACQNWQEIERRENSLPMAMTSSTAVDEKDKCGCLYSHLLELS